MATTVDRADAGPVSWALLLALDAPLVAGSWYAACAGALAEAVRPACAAVLGLSVWLVYSADRWLDGRRLHRPHAASARHRLAAGGGRLPVAVWACVLALDVVVALRGLSAEELRVGYLVLAGAALYLAAVHLPGPARWWVPKEALVGILFSAGVSAFVWPALTPASRTGLVAFALCFAAVCWLDCQLVSLWERRVDVAQGLATASGGLGRRQVLVLLAVAAVAILLVGRAWLPVGLTAALLLAVAWLLLLTAATEGSQPPRRGRQLVDLGLAAPALLLLAIVRPVVV
ncbi:MAG: hypothetical protein DWQ36_20110 [Acidobacteria bacterium]|nr:MAG: hypothetical protein DWQ36_20110 [Acidobacteriota bacterium]